MSQVLLNPALDAGGGGTAAAPVPSPQPQQQPQQQMTELRTAPVQPQGFWVPPESWNQQQAELTRLREFEAQQTAIIEAERQKAIQAMAEKGKIEEALTAMRGDHERKQAELSEKARRIEQNWLAEKRNAAIADALAGKVFNGDPAHAAAQLRLVLESEVEAVLDQNGNPIVRDKKTMQPAADYLKQQIESPRFSHFFAAMNQGGAGANATRPAPTATSLDPRQGVIDDFFRRKREAEAITYSYQGQ